MSTQILTTNKQPTVLSSSIEKALIEGDLSGLKVEERISYYNHVCDSMGLNPFTKPFAYIVLQGKMTLYAKKECTDQLRSLHKVSIQIPSRERFGDIYVVSARASDASGRTDESTGAVCIGNLKGDALANAFMKAETKAKRRATLSFTGLSMLDETEIDSIKDAKRVEVDYVPQQPKAIEAEISEKPVSFFSSKNLNQVTKLQDILKSAKIAENMHTKIMDYFEGKEVSREINSIIERVKSGDTLDGVAPAFRNDREFGESSRA